MFLFIRACFLLCWNRGASLVVNGDIYPGRRSGHTSTVVGRYIFVFGGSHGTDYLEDFFMLDTGNLVYIL